MTPFVWFDRDSRGHELDGPGPIEAEAVAVMDEMDRCVAILDNPDSMVRDPARAAIRNLQPRLEQLRADLASWNAHAFALTRTEAAKLAKQIDGLPGTIADITLVVDLHDEHDRMIEMTSGAPASRTDIFGFPATAVQRRAIEASRSRGAPEAPTRAEAKTWIDDQPRFARGSAVDGGWFAWGDRNGHAHRLHDPLPIEREVVSIARELGNLRSTLRSTDDPIALQAAIIAGLASWERLQILERDLGRFEREAEARDQATWKEYAADWRSKRKTT